MSFFDYGLNFKPLRMPLINNGADNLCYNPLPFSFGFNFQGGSLFSFNSLPCTFHSSDSTMFGTFNPKFLNTNFSFSNNYNLSTNWDCSFAHNYNLSTDLNSLWQTPSWTTNCTAFDCYTATTFGNEPVVATKPDKTDETDKTEKSEDKFADKVKKEAIAMRHWSKMSDEELLQVYGNYTRDITQPYNGDAAKLDEYLSGKGVLAGKGKAFMDAQKKYGISAAVLIAICSLESAHGTSNLAKTKNNVGGVRLKGSTTFRNFACVDDCIEEMARLLKDNYVNNNGRSLKYLYQVNAKYCPANDTTDKTGGNSRWARSVESIAKKVETVAA